jgi:cobalt-zinc-cadmium efflux system outer membrane protein
VAVAQEAAGLAQVEWQATRQNIRADVVTAWHAVHIAARKLDVAQALTDLARRTVDVAGKRVAAGRISPIDETRARLAAVDAATALTQATSALTIARTRLGALVGQPADTLVLAADSASLPDVEPLATLLARAGESTAIRRAQGQLAVRQAQADAERAARVPDVTVSIGTQRDDQASRRQAVVGLAVPLPLFNRNEDALRAALLRTDQASDALAAAHAGMAAALTAAHTRYATARTEAAVLGQDVVPNARAAYEQTLKGFEYGKFSFLDVLDAQRTWFQAQTRQWDSLENAWRTYADIERLAGPAGQR